MQFDTVLLPARRDASVAAGFWLDRTINDALDDCLAQCPDKTAITSVQMETGRTDRFTYRELARLADRIGMGLLRLGVGRGDVVSVQLPNGWAVTATYLACSRIGAVLNPLMPIFRERELSFMLSHAQSKVFIVPKTYRGFDFEKMAQGLKLNLPALKQVVVLGGSQTNSFHSLLSGPAWEAEHGAAELLRRHRPHPDDVTQLLYTSGTTGEPKAAMHTANTLMANIGPFAQRLKLGADDVVLMPSPMAHQTGFMYGLLMPIVLRASVVLQDTWEPRRAVDLVRDHGCSFTMGSTPFLADLARTVAETGQDVPTLRSFLCAGAPIPGPLVERARLGVGTKIVSAWGMTENGAVTLTGLDDDDRLACTTDGSPLPGVQIKVVDFDGQSLPAGQPGKLLVRACSNFGGYLKRPQLNATDADGWFDTGDLARIDARGYLRITGRSKDLIIRGGESIPVVEIEALLYKHPAIAMVAIVGYPDDRLGERACAMVVCKPGQKLDLPSLVAYLEAQKVARQYMPERLQALAEMPATPAGKIQKFKLREMLRAL